MGYHPRIESREMSSFLTTRTQASELWFVNNQKLEKKVLAYAAKYQSRYEVQLYALAIEGNHIQGAAKFPHGNRANFMRDFNSSVARAVPHHVEHYRGGRLWGRRYSYEFLPGPEDIKDRFFYTVLQPVQDGLVERISDYPGYNCFHDAVYGITRSFKIIRWGEYNAAKRHNPSISIKDYTDVYKLRYTRLPGYEHLSQKAYAKLMYKELEERRQKIVQERYKEGLGFAGPTALRAVIAGSKPKSTKTSKRTSHRPRVISKCPKRYSNTMAMYFNTYASYKKASKEFRAGNLNVKFPPGTYPPRPPPIPPP
jgi:hypothetical protein